MSEKEYLLKLINDINIEVKKSRDNELKELNKIKESVITLDSNDNFTTHINQLHKFLSKNFPKPCNENSDTELIKQLDRIWREALVNEKKYIRQTDKLRKKRKLLV